MHAHKTHIAELPWRPNTKMQYSTHTHTRTRARATHTHIPICMHTQNTRTAQLPCRPNTQMQHSKHTLHGTRVRRVGQSHAHTLYSCTSYMTDHAHTLYTCTSYMTVYSVLSLPIFPHIHCTYIHTYIFWPTLYTYIHTYMFWPYTCSDQLSIYVLTIYMFWPTLSIYMFWSYRPFTITSEIN